MIEKHQQRCETCNEIMCVWKDQKKVRYFTEVCGCASHSSAKTEKNKLLDEMLEKLGPGNLDLDTDTTDDWYGFGWSDCRDNLIKFVESLRNKRWE